MRVIRTHPSVAYDWVAYRRRHRVEQAWGRLKQWRAVAASLDWIKHGHA